MALLQSKYLSSCSLEAGESAEEIAAHVLENKQRNDRVLIRETLVNVTKVSVRPKSTTYFRRGGVVKRSKNPKMSNFNIRMLLSSKFCKIITVWGRWTRRHLERGCLPHSPSPISATGLK